MELFETYGLLLIVFAAVVGFYMAWGIGANDVANAMGTSVGAKAITLKQAVLIAAIFEFAGAYLAGGEVTSTIRKGIIDSTPFISAPELLVLGMIASLMAAGTWLALASAKGWPVSTTHSIIGAIVGFAVVGVGVDAVSWGKVGGIVGSWIVTPAISGLIAYMIYRSAEKLIFNTDHPVRNAKKYVPVYMAFAGFVLALVTIKKGLKHIIKSGDLSISTTEAYLYAMAVGILVALIGSYFVSKVKIDPSADRQEHFLNVENIFAVLMVVTACCMAFAHGSNDVANAIGPLAAVVNVVTHNGEITKQAPLAWWILPLGGIGIVAGLALFGSRVMKTIGEKITHLTPSRGFAAELAAATTVVIASGTGLPISTTQTLVGAVLGVGLAQGMAALDMKTVRSIAMSWVITLPIGAAFSIIFFFILKWVLL